LIFPSAGSSPAAKTYLLFYLSKINPDFVSNR
jgi:hypothetical protein